MCVYIYIYVHIWIHKYVYIYMDIYVCVYFRAETSSVKRGTTNWRVSDGGHEDFCLGH